MSETEKLAEKLGISAEQLRRLIEVMKEHGHRGDLLDYNKILLFVSNHSELIKL